MSRIFKHYAFTVSRETAATKVMTFSSYPGYLSSLDDFYIMDRCAIHVCTEGYTGFYLVGGAGGKLLPQIPTFSPKTL